MKLSLSFLPSLRVHSGSIEEFVTVCVQNWTKVLVLLSSQQTDDEHLWEDGEWEDGEWEDGEWEDGEWEGGKWEGVEDGRVGVGGCGGTKEEKRQ